MRFLIKGLQFCSIFFANCCVNLINHFRKIDIVVSNVSGPKKEFDFFGRKVMTYSAFSPVIPPANITVIIQTYNNFTRAHVTCQQGLPFTSKEICEGINRVLDAEIQRYKCQTG